MADGRWQSSAVETFGSISRRASRGAHCLLPSAYCLLFLLEKVFEELHDAGVFAAAEVADGRLAPLQRLGRVADDLFELLVGARVLVAADGAEQLALEVVVALRVVDRE